MFENMEGHDSNGASWADQWDYNPDPAPAESNKKKTGLATAKYKEKMGEGLVKTKTVASHGVKKVKEGTTVGIQWIKAKCQKTTHKN